MLPIYRQSARHPQLFNVITININADFNFNFNNFNININVNANFNVNLIMNGLQIYPPTL